MSKTMNIQTFAYNLGASHRMTKDASAPFHTCYVNADAAGKAQLRGEWMVGYVAGNCGVTLEAAERILSKGKGAGAKPAHIEAIDCATSHFRYHVVRPTAKAGADKTSEEIAVPKHLRDLAKALADACNEYENSRKLASTALAQAFAK